jgi:hypothetical protein
MAKLTPSARARLSNSNFAGPGRSFPVFDKDHARAAIIDSARSVKAGHISASERSKIIARAKRVLSK